MNKYDIQATQENLILSMEKNVTGRNTNLFNLLKLLNSQERSLSIAINGAWGSGKTFFVKQCQLILDNALNCKTTKIRLALDAICSNEQLKDIQKIEFRTAYYDAWEHDSEEDPIASLLRCLATAEWSTNTKEILGKAVNIGIDILAATAHIDLSKLAKDLKDKKKNIGQLEILRQQFNDTIAKLAPESGKLIIFIDELDRCKPTYAVKLLERIKHYFSNPNVTFIFSVDLNQLQYTINNYYGVQFDGYQYLDRFFDLVISLPEPDIDRYFDNTKNILETSNHIWNDRAKESSYYLFCKELIKEYSLSLRQINHFYLKVNSASYNLIDRIVNYRGVGLAERNGKFIIYEFILPLMCAISQKNVKEYKNFITGRASDNTLNVLAKSKCFTTWYKGMLDNKQNIDIKSEISRLYNSIFVNTTDPSLKISEKCYITYPSKYKKRLIAACNLLSPDVHLV